MKTATQQILLSILWTFLFIYTGTFSHLVAQTIKARSFGVDDGLSDFSVRDILTDKFGYKWITTGHGLNQYDGHSFKKFRYDPRDSFSIRANSLSQIFEDLKGNIWASIDIGGMSMLDRATQKFHYFNYSSEEPSHLNNYPRSVFFDNLGRGWVGTRHAINWINLEKNRFEPIVIPNLPNLSVFAISQDQKNRVWIGANKGLFVYNETRETFEEVKDKSGQSIVNISRFLNDRAGNLWMSSSRNGVFRLNDNSPTPIQVDHPTNDDDIVTNLFQSKSSGAIISIGEKGLFEWNHEQWKPLDIEGMEGKEHRFAYSNSSNDDIFLLTHNNRVALFNPQLGTTHWLEDFNKPILGYSLDNNNEGLWLATLDFGLYQVTRSESYFNSILIESHPGRNENYTNYIFDLFSTPEGESYFVTGTGLYKIDEKEGAISHTIDYWRPGDFGTGISSAVIFDSDHFLLTTRKGLFKYNKNSGKTTKFLDLDERITEIVRHDDNVWAIGGFGLLVHDLKKDSTTLFRDLPDTPQTLKTNMSRKLLVDRDGIVWVGTVREGLFRVEKNNTGFDFERFMYSGIKASGFKSHTVNELYEDKAGHLWVGSFSTGLLEFDRKNNEFINYTPLGELPIPNVQAIEEADDGCLWLSAADGIHKYIPAENIFKRYTKENGLSSNSFVLGSSTTTKNGIILFGSDNGITSFDPSQVDSYIDLPEVMLEEISVFNKRIDSPVLTSQLQELKLKHNENFLSFDFIALDFINADRIIYTYQVEGLSDNWIGLDKNRSLSINNLKPGDYKLNLRAAFNEGNWGEITTLKISIGAPFWLKPWFYGIVLITIATILWALHQYRLKLKLSKLTFMEEVRQKAAADFHDEMGNKLTRIALFTDVLKQKLNGSSQEISEYINKIRDNSRSLNSSMRDFLWALDPKKDTAHDVAVLLKDFGEELFDKTNISFSVECIESDLQRYKLDMDWKRNLIMIFKEAMHNTLKHANATRASLAFSLEEDEVKIVFLDNGTGLFNKNQSGGYGLTNMSYRTKQLAGSLQIDNLSSGGTAIQFIGNLKSFSTA